MYDLITISFLSIILGIRIGIFIGLNRRSKKLDAKKQEIENLMIAVRKKNNEMLTNFSKVAHVTTNTEGQWTEVDDFLMPMWME